MSLPLRLDDIGLPGRRHEQWRWTDLSAIEAARAARANDAAPDPRVWLIDGVAGPVLLFVDGRYCAQGSDPQHLTIETSGGDETHPLSRLTRGAVGATLRLGAEHATTWGRTFADALPGRSVLYRDSLGLLSLAVNQGSP